jgi:NADH dehydrogenase [ubiquinone] 1 alpha subcomplex assembly factor 5
MGESNALANRKPYTSRDVFLAAAASYQAIYGRKVLQDGVERNCIPATFQAIYLIGWKQDEIKPLKRGTASTSLQEALGHKETKESGQ